MKRSQGLSERAITNMIRVIKEAKSRGLLKMEMFGNNIFPINPPRFSPPTKEKSRKISKIRRLIQLTIFTRFSLTNYLPGKIAKKFILNKHRAEMSLQFSVDELIQPLVSLSYLSSEEEMEVDCPSTGTEQDQDQDSDIEVIACFRETSMPIPKKVGGRGMTLDLSSCADNDSLSNTLCSEGSYFNSEPNSELIDLVLGLHPPTGEPTGIEGHPMATCSQLAPVPDSPQSPPPHEKGHHTGPQLPQWDHDEPLWPWNSHITGVAVRTSGYCGTQNLVQPGDCLVCGKSADMIHEEVTFDYLERTHRAGESYETRQRRRHAFQAGMQAGAFVLVPRGLSQSTACDGNSYQIVPNEMSDMPLPAGVLPL